MFTLHHLNISIYPFPCQHSDLHFTFNLWHWTQWTYWSPLSSLDCNFNQENPNLHFHKNIFHHHTIWFILLWNQKDNMRPVNPVDFLPILLISSDFPSKWEKNIGKFERKGPFFRPSGSYAHFAHANVPLRIYTRKNFTKIRVFRESAVPPEGTIHQNKEPRGRHALFHCCLLMLCGELKRAFSHVLLLSFQQIDIGICVFPLSGICRRNVHCAIVSLPRRHGQLKLFLHNKYRFRSIGSQRNCM